MTACKLIYRSSVTDITKWLWIEDSSLPFMIIAHIRIRENNFPVLNNSQVLLFSESCMHSDHDYDFAIHVMSRFYLYSIGVILGGFNFIIYFGYVTMWLTLVAAQQKTAVNIYIRRTKSQNSIILVSSYSGLCPIHWSQVLSREWRCSWSTADSRCSNYIWVIHNYIANYGVSFIGLTVLLIANDLYFKQ